MIIVFRNSSRDGVLANELAESDNLKQISFKGCSANGVVPQTVEEENYKTILLRLLSCFPLPQGSALTLSLQ